jgi:hypothetical protein
VKFSASKRLRKRVLTLLSLEILLRKDLISFCSHPQLEPRGVFLWDGIVASLMV